MLSQCQRSSIWGKNSPLIASYRYGNGHNRRRWPTFLYSIFFLMLFPRETGPAVLGGCGGFLTGLLDFLTIDQNDLLTLWRQLRGFLIQPEIPLQVIGQGDPSPYCDETSLHPVIQFNRSLRSGT